MAAEPAVHALSVALRLTVKNKKAQERRRALKKKRFRSLSYVEAGSNQWNRKVLCIIKGSKLYMFRHAPYLSDRGNVFFLLNQAIEDYPKYNTYGIENRSFVAFPKKAVLEIRGRLCTAPLWLAHKVPPIAAINCKDREVILRNGKKLRLSSLTLPKEVIVSHKRAGRKDDGFGGATRHLYRDNSESISLGDDVDWLFWRYHANQVPALEGRIVRQNPKRPFEFDILEQ